MNTRNIRNIIILHSKNTSNNNLILVTELYTKSLNSLGNRVNNIIYKVNIK